MDLSRNNLDRSQSPYLYQHRDNPVHWQEWGDHALERARADGRILFVSVGYSTCHWCHVMAEEAFSDEEVADYLNQYFLPVKVDREQRPDIDQYLMGFLVATTGQGGWPLNAFLSPELKPFFAMTYASVRPRFGMPGFLDILKRVKEFYDNKKNDLRNFEPGLAMQRSSLSEELEQLETEDEALSTISRKLQGNIDDRYGGFGTSQKFPPHSSLLYMLFHHSVAPEESLEQDIRLTLDTMQLRGLHDHLRGGIFRYCVDREWTIPHFEKMLYDQAMALWYYSVAGYRFDEPRYHDMVSGLLGTLEHTFEHDGLYHAGHDADTEHEEGATYLWTLEEIREELGSERAALAERVFDLSEGGNFRGRNHLVRKLPDSALSSEERRELSGVMNQLLRARNRRKQPFTDRKILTSWNCIAGLGLLAAHRYAGKEEAFEKSVRLADRLLDRHFEDGALCHSSIDGHVQRQEFLSDYAAFLLLASHLHEDTRTYGETIASLRERMAGFRSRDGWLESRNEDFLTVPADAFDSPIPSSVSLVETAELRCRILNGESYEQLPFRAPGMTDFANIGVLASRGYFHLVESPEPLPWGKLPLNSIQHEGSRLQVCYRGVCRPGLPDD